MHIELDIPDLKIGFRKDVCPHPILVDHAGGSLKLTIERQELESAVLAVLQWAVAEHQIRIESAKLDVTSSQNHQVEVHVRAHARKLILSAIINVGARVQVGDDLVVRLSDLTCDGEGMIGKLAAMVIRSKMEGLKDARYPLPVRLPVPAALRFADPVVHVNGQTIELKVGVTKEALPPGQSAG